MRCQLGENTESSLRVAGQSAVIARVLGKAAGTVRGKVLERPQGSEDSALRYRTRMRYSER
jgi:hypothetical protein